MKSILAFAMAFAMTLFASAEQPECQAVNDCFPGTPEAFRALSVDELEALFASGDGTRMPQGELRGSGLFKPGTSFGRFLSSLSTVIWKGKYFSPEDQTIENLVGPFASRMITGALGTGTGLDGKPSITVTYSDTLGDEIRWLGGNSYLGRGVKDGAYGVYFFMIARDSAAQ